MAVETLVAHLRSSEPAKRLVTIGWLLAVAVPAVLWFAPLPLARRSTNRQKSSYLAPSIYIFDYILVV